MENVPLISNVEINQAKQDTLPRENSNEPIEI